MFVCVNVARWVMCVRLSQLEWDGDILTAAQSQLFSSFVKSDRNTWKNTESNALKFTIKIKAQYIHNKTNVLLMHTKCTKCAEMSVSK